MAKRPDLITIEDDDTSYLKTIETLNDKLEKLEKERSKAVYKERERLEKLLLEESSRMEKMLTSNEIAAEYNFEYNNLFSSVASSSEIIYIS